MLSLLLVSLLAGKPVSLSGGTVSVSDLQTTAAMTLYMDPTGNDSNPCTSSGTGACLTFDGIYSKIPRFIRHNITVNVAAGSYTFNSRWDGVTWGSSTTGSTGSTVIFEGPAFTTHTPATGTSTGTLTSVSVPIVGPLPVLTDSAQSWTVNELRGRFITMTSGTANGVSRPIIANTATTITTMVYPSTGSAIPAAGNTYTIETPAAIITGEQYITSHTGARGILRFTRLDFTSASASAPTLNVFSNGIAFTTFSLPLTRILHTSGSPAGLSCSGSTGPTSTTITGNASAPWVAIHTGTGIAVAVNDVPPLSYAGGGFAYSASTTAFSMNNAGSGAGTVPWMNLVAETGGAATNAVNFDRVNGGNGGGSSLNYISTRCPVGSTGIGLQLTSSGFGQTSYESTNCGTGLRVGTSSAFAIDSPPSNGLLAVGGSGPQLRCTSTTTCLRVAKGSRFKLLVGYTLSGVTDEVVVDELTSTFAAVNVLSPKRLTGNAGSIFEME